MKYFWLVLFFCIPFATASYADVQLDIAETGIITITGNSDSDVLRERATEEFTFKRGPYWLLNLTTEELETYVAEIAFPKGTEINYIKVEGTFRVVEEDRLKIITTGENKSLSLLIQYRVQTPLAESITQGWPYIIAAIAILAIIGLLVLSKKNRPKTNKSAFDAVKSTLTDNQKQILDILTEAKEDITQKQILHRTGLPKATLSRNIKILTEKGILKKQSRGMVNVIQLNKDFGKKE